MKTLDRAIDLARKGRHPEALEAFGRALQSGASRTTVLGHRAWLLRHLGKYEESLRDYDELVRLQPDDLDARCRKAETLLLSGDQEAAEQEIRALVAKDSNARGVLELFGRYQQTRGGGVTTNRF